jgi:hypothetical protein
MIEGVAVELGVEWEDERRDQCREERIGKGTGDMERGLISVMRDNKSG